MGRRAKGQVGLQSHKDFDLYLRSNGKKALKDGEQGEDLPWLPGAHSQELRDSHSEASALLILQLNLANYHFHDVACVL